MFGKVEELLELVPPASRLHRGLTVLQDFQKGLRQEWVKTLAGLKAREKVEIAIEGDSIYAIPCRLASQRRPRALVAGRDAPDALVRKIVIKVKDAHVSESPVSRPLTPGRQYERSQR